MIIDFHTHIYPEKIAAATIKKMSDRSELCSMSDGTADGLMHSMREAGVDYSVVLPVATSVRQHKTINKNAISINEDTKQTGIYSFGGIHPDNEDYKDILKDLKASGVKGIKLHPDYQDTFFNDIRYKRIIGAAEEQEMIVVIHAGLDIGRPEPVHVTVDMIKEVYDEVKPTRLVLAHMGGWQMWQQVLDKLCGLPVYFDTAFSFGDISWSRGAKMQWKLMNEDEFTGLVRAHGADRILFGTDSPFISQKKAVEDIRGLSLTTLEKEKIFGENAKKLLKNS